jgi:hypothetical protein
MAITSDTGSDFKKNTGLAFHKQQAYIVGCGRQVDQDQNTLDLARCSSSFLGSSRVDAAPTVADDLMLPQLSLSISIMDTIGDHYEPLDPMDRESALVIDGDMLFDHGRLDCSLFAQL